MTEYKETHEKVFDLSDNRDLTEIERIKSRPDKYRISCEETIMLPFRHISYEVLPQNTEGEKK